MKSLRLWRLRRERKRSDRKYAKLINAADGDEREALLSEAGQEREEFDDAIRHLQALELIEKAQDLGLPYPRYSQNRESWEDGREPGTVHLTQQAQIKLRQEIRAEQREKWSFAAFVLKEIITPIIGVLGAIMGLLSLIHAFRSK